MGNIFNISGGQCTAGSINWDEYNALRERLGDELLESMDSSLDQLPLNREAMAKATLNQLLPAKGAGGEARAMAMCNAILMGEKVKGSEGPLPVQEISQQGFFTANAKLSLAGCPNRLDSYYFGGDPTCADLKAAIKGESVPSTMYMLPMSYDRAMKILGDPDNMSAFSKKENAVAELGGKRAPFACTTKRGESATFSFPIKIPSWEMKYIVVGNQVSDAANRMGYNHWYHVPSCDVGNITLEATGLLFDFGARVFADVGAEIDGRQVEQSLVLSYIASVPTSAVIKPIFMSRGRGLFYKAESDRRMFLMKSSRE